MRAHVDPDVCMGSGQCLLNAPGSFDLDDDSVAYVVESPTDSEEAIRAAAARCPSGAIKVSDD